MKRTLFLLLITTLFVTSCAKKNDPPPINIDTTTPRVTVTVSTFAGSGNRGSADGTGAAASFFQPTGLVADAAGNIYVADLGNDLIRKISPGGVVTTVAGTGVQGFANGTGRAAAFFEPSGLALDASGNLFVADYGNNQIRKISPAGVVTTFAGSGDIGSADGTGTTASFYVPTGVAADAVGNLYVVDFGNSHIRKITPAGVVTTLGEGTGTPGGFSGPTGISIGTDGNIYVADYGNNRIKVINSSGVITSLAYFDGPTGLAATASGNIYVALPGLNQVGQISSIGALSVFAGTGDPGADNGDAVTSSFFQPFGVCTDAAGNIYVADSGNDLIRKIVIH